MAIKRKRNNNIVKLNDTIATTPISTSRTETWVGPYDLLRAKQNAAASTASSTSLSPAEADTGTLTITYQREPPEPPPAAEAPIIEVEWVELRKKIEEAPYFSSVTPQDVVKARAWAEDTSKPKPTGRAGELADKLARGQTEFSIAVPVVRRTTYSPTSLTSGGAWFRNFPPVGLSGWQFLKTADRVSRQGRRFQRVEEWTGAKEWDANIYP